MRIYCYIILCLFILNVNAFSQNADVIIEGNLYVKGDFINDPSISTNNIIFEENNEPQFNHFSGYRSGFTIKNGGSGKKNSFFGSFSGYSNNNGWQNTFVGYGAGYYNISGEFNTFVGYRAGISSKSDFNTFIGQRSGQDNNFGSDNTAVGSNSLQHNSAGSNNVSVGKESGYLNSTGFNNSFVGHQSGLSNTTGRENTFVGKSAGYSNSVGNNNTIVGWEAGVYENQSNNVFIGSRSGSQNGNYSNSIAIGTDARSNGSFTAVIGNSQISTIGGYANWSNLSDARFKKEIRSDIPGLRFILNLNPVSYIIDEERLIRFKGEKVEINRNRVNHRRTGLIAQEVEKLVNDLNYDFSGLIIPRNENDHYRLSYAEFVVPLIKAVQEQQELIEELQKKIELLMSTELSSKKAKK